MELENEGSGGRAKKEDKKQSDLINQITSAILRAAEQAERIGQMQGDESDSYNDYSGDSYTGTSNDEGGGQQGTVFRQWPPKGWDSPLLKTSQNGLNLPQGMSLFQGNTGLPTAENLPFFSKKTSDEGPMPDLTPQVTQKTRTIFDQPKLEQYDFRTPLSSGTIAVPETSDEPSDPRAGMGKLGEFYNPLDNWLQLFSLSMQPETNDFGIPEQSAKPLLAPPKAEQTENVSDRTLARQQELLKQAAGPAPSRFPTEGAERESFDVRVRNRYAELNPTKTGGQQGEQTRKANSLDVTHATELSNYGRTYYIYQKNKTWMEQKVLKTEHLAQLVTHLGIETSKQEGQRNRLLEEIETNPVPENQDRLNRFDERLAEDRTRLDSLAKQLLHQLSSQEQETLFLERLRQRLDNQRDIVLLLTEQKGNALRQVARGEVNNQTYPYLIEGNMELAMKVFQFGTAVLLSPENLQGVTISPKALESLQEQYQVWREFFMTGTDTGSEVLLRGHDYGITQEQVDQAKAERDQQGEILGSIVNNPMTAYDPFTKKGGTLGEPANQRWHELQDVYADQRKKFDYQTKSRRLVELEEVTQRGDFWELVDKGKASPANLVEDFFKDPKQYAEAHDWGPDTTAYYYAFMTERERTIYNALLALNPEQAKEYLKLLHGFIQEESTPEWARWEMAYFAEHPADAVARNAATVFEKPLSFLEYGSRFFKEIFMDSYEADPAYSPFLQGLYYDKITREALLSKFDTEEEKARVDLSLTMIQFAMTLLLGKNAPIVISMNVGAEAGLDVQQRGGSTAQIVSSMFLNTMAAYGLSKFPVGRFFKTVNQMSGGEKVLVGLLKDMTEGMVVSLGGHTVSVATDEMIMGDASWVATLAKEYERQGLTHEEAIGFARWKLYVEGGIDAMKTGVEAGFMGGKASRLLKMLRTVLLRRGGTAILNNGATAPSQKNALLSGKEPTQNPNAKLTQGQNGGIINQPGTAGKPVRTYSYTELLSKSTCTPKQLTGYLSANADTDAVSVYRKTGKWPSDIQVPKSAACLTPKGDIDWSKAPKGGYVLKTSGEPSRTVYVPQVGEILDRYGPSNGRFTCPVKDGVPFSYDQRSLPYIEDPAQYHQYKVVGDFTQLEWYVSQCQNEGIVQNIQDVVNQWYGGDYQQATIYSGQIAAIEGWGSGGGVQYQLPFRIDWLIELGLLEEIK